LLNIDGALDGLDDTGKLGQKTIAHQLHDAATAPRDFRLHQFLAQRFQPLQGPGFVGTHEARVADHVGGQDCGKAAFHKRPPVWRETSDHGGKNPCW